MGDAASGQEWNLDFTLFDEERSSTMRVCVNVAGLVCRDGLMMSSDG
jgi:hypothetical protein